MKVSLSRFYKCRLYVIFILLIVFAFYTTVNITGIAFKSLGIVKKQEADYGAVDHNRVSMRSHSGTELKEYTDSQVFDDITFDKYRLYIMNLEMLFFKLIIILSFYQSFLYVRRWIIMVYQFKIKFFIVRYLELKDGKKNALSFQFSF